MKRRFLGILLTAALLCQLLGGMALAAGEDTGGPAAADGESTEDRGDRADRGGAADGENAADEGGPAADTGVTPAQDTVHVKYKVFFGITASPDPMYTGWMDWKQDGAAAEAGSENERLEAVNICLEGAAVTGSIEYQSSVQGYGWQPWCKDGAMAGTAGQARRLEAVRIRLTEEMETQYDVYYRVNVRGYGWLGWAKNGEDAGSEGKEVKGIQIQLMAKGAAAPEGTGKQPFVTVNYTLTGSKMVIDETGIVDFGKIPEADRSRVTELVIGEGVRYLSYFDPENMGTSTADPAQVKPSFENLTALTVPTTYLAAVFTETVEGEYDEKEFRFPVKESAARFPFANCSKLTTVTLPEGLKSIEGLFYGCKGLTQIRLPESLESIGNCAFEESGLTELTVPGKVRRIGYSALAETPVVRVTLPKGVEVIDEGAFTACTALEALVLPDSVKEIGTGAFSDCTALKTVRFPAGIDIGNGSFRGCESLTELAVPERATVRWLAFAECAGLERVSIHDTVILEGEQTFGECVKLKEIDLPKTGIDNILCVTFGDCLSLEEIRIPGTVRELDGTFYNCRGLKKVLLEEGLESIGYCTFYNCTGLERLDIPASVAAIDKAAFEGCDLTKLVLGVHKDSYAEKYCAENKIRYELLTDAAVSAPEVDAGAVTDAGAKQAAGSVALKGFDEWLQERFGAILGNDRGNAVEQAKKELHAAEEEIRVYVQGYLDIALKDYRGSGADKSLSMDITPKVRVVASTAEDAGGIILSGSGRNAVQYGAAKKADVKETEVRVTLPRGFITEDGTTVYVKHRAADGTYYYRSKANRDGLLTFVTRHGFSPFTISLNADAAALVGETGYDTLQEAVDAVENGGTVIVLRDGLTAKVSGEKTFSLDADGHTGILLTAAEGYTLKENGNGSYTVSEAGMTAKLQYQSHIQSLGWEKDWTENGGVSGTMHQSKRLEALRMKIEDPGVSGNIRYRTHIQSLGWEEGWKQDDEVSGTTGKKKRLEAIQIQLTDGLAEKYDVYYRAYVQSYGWLGWAKNGQSAGSEGLAKRMEAIEVRLVKKGSAAPGNSRNAFVKKGQTTGINYRTHVQSYDWMDWASNGQRAGTEGKAKRLEALELRLADPGVSGGVRYRSHVQSFGWEKDWKQDGALSGTTGKSKRLEAVRIELTGEAAERYDIYYRVHVQSYGWLDWAKNGESAGSEGFAKRLEAVEVRLVEKGGAAPGKTDRSFIKK